MAVSPAARAYAARLLANYPGWPITDVHVLALAETFDEIGVDLADDVVEVARFDFTKPPSSAQLLEIAGRVRADRPRLPALEPSGEPIPMPDWVRKKYVRFAPVADNPAGAKVERAKAKEAALAEQIEESRVRLAALSAGTRMKGACKGTGKAPVERGGRRVCPDCGVEVPDLEVRIERPRRKRPA